MIAAYMMVDDPTLQTLTALSGEALSQKVLELEDEIDESAADTAYHETDKLWDALHFFLTGASATTPIENNPLSEAIVGVTNFSEDETADFIAYIKHTDLKRIITALDEFKFETQVSYFDLTSLKEKKIFPNGIWEMDKTQLITELRDARQSLIDFYKNALAKKLHVVVSIL
jgi:hypothetical protein